MFEKFWIENKNRDEFKNIDTIVLNQDNWPECQSRRTQFIKRICEFSVKYNLKIQLAYYPPYHSKYNPIERIWWALEQHWNWDIMDTKETALKFASTMKWKNKIPKHVSLIKKVYNTWQRLTEKVMKLYETVIDRCEKLWKWFVEIIPEKVRDVVNQLAS